MKRIVAITALALMFAGLAAAQVGSPETAPATCPAAETQCAPVATAPASRPAATATSAPAIDPAAMKILTDQEAAGRKYSTIKADLTMRLVDRRVGDIEERTGWLAYQRAEGASGAKFRIHFDTLKQDKGRRIKQELDWAFDGNWLTRADPAVKQILRFQVVPEGQESDPMRLGEGPLPLPFGQKAAEVIQYYEPSTRPLEPGEPAGTIYLKLIARKEHYRKLDSVRMEVWIDPKTQLPVKLVSRDKNKKVTTATFKNVKTNVKIDAKEMFEIPRPPGWTEQRKPLGR